MRVCACVRVVACACVCACVCHVRACVSCQSFQHRWHPQPIRHRRTAAVAGSKAGRACSCACDGAGAAAGRQRPDRRGGLLRGRRGGFDRCSRGRRSSLPHSAVGCKLCVRAVRIGAHIGRERAAARARGFPAGGAGSVLWHGFHQTLSRRPEQREQPQWPSRLHLCGGGATTAAETARWRRVGTRVDWSCSR